MHKYLLTAVFILKIAVISSFGQDDRPIRTILDSLNYTNELPKDILSTKTMVLVDVPPRSKDPYIRGNWEAFAEQAQPGFQKAGIDAVVYYHIEDVYSGKESYNSFRQQLKDRQIENIAFLISSGGSYRIVLAKINDGHYIINAGEEAWQDENKSLDILMDNVYKKAANSSQKRENLLVMEVPEFGEMPQVIKGRRGEYYDLNFSSEKLAIPVFGDTARINLAMTNYPYEYGFVDPKEEEKFIRSNGYQYILYYVHSTATTVEEMLEYEVKENQSKIVSEVVIKGESTKKSYRPETPVYKFYIKHIYSGNVFLGKRWDAAPTWEEALSNYVENLRNELVK